MMDERKVQFEVMEVIRISKEEDFLNLRDRWNLLFSESGQDNIFLTWDWMYNWWEIFKKKKDELFILLCQEDSKLLGIAPFYIRNNFYKEIRFLGSGIACSDYLDCIASKNNRLPVLNAILDFLSKANGVWDLLILEGLLSDFETKSLIENYVRTENWRCKVTKEFTCFYLSLPSTFEEFKKALSSSRIKRVRRQMRKLSQEGLVEFKELGCSGNEDLSSNFEIVVSLHQKRWRNLKCKIGGAFSNELFLKFMRTITKVFYENNWLSIVSLTLNGRPIAVDYNFKFNKKIYSYTGGFDPAYQQRSPGLLCLWESLRFYIDRGYQEYNFLRGDENYKRSWNVKSCKEHDLLIAKSNLKGFVFLFCVSFLIFTRNSIKKIAPPKLITYLKALRAIVRK